MATPDTEQDIFASAMTDEPAEEGTAQTTTTTTTEEPEPAVIENDDGDEGEDHGQGRDPATGKFLPKPKAEGEGDESKPDGQQQGNGEQRGNIPPARLREEAEARRQADARAEAAERRLADMERQLTALRQPPRREPEPKPAAPSMWEDPEGFVQAQIDPVQKAQEQIIDRFSRMMAVQAHGQEVVTKAFEELAAEVEANPAARFEAQRIWKSEHPYGALVEWHRNRAALKEIGSDPAAYKAKLREELLNDPEHLKAAVEKVRSQNGGGAQQQGNGQRPGNTITRLPPSLSRLASAAPNNQGGDEGEVTDTELFQGAMRGK